MRTEKIPNALYTQMCSLKEQRDRLAMKIGVAWLEFEKHASSWRMDINRLQHEEKQAVEQELKKLGIDPETRVVANYETGEFLIED